MINSSVVYDFCKVLASRYSTFFFVASTHDLTQPLPVPEGQNLFDPTSTSVMFFLHHVPGPGHFTATRIVPVPGKARTFCLTYLDPWRKKNTTATRFPLAVRNALEREFEAAHPGKGKLFFEETPVTVLGTLDGQARDNHCGRYCMLYIQHHLESGGALPMQGLFDSHLAPSAIMAYATRVAASILGRTLDVGEEAPLQAGGEGEEGSGGEGEVGSRGESSAHKEE
jgi:hypothetical protein